MGCTDPMIFEGKTFVGFLRWEGSKRDGWEPVSKDVAAKRWERIKKGELQLVPCGKCTSCRLSYASNWANRLVIEQQYHKNNYFATLTYDNYNVPVANIYDSSIEIGKRKVIENRERSTIVLEEGDRLTLYKKDVQDFKKRLRRYMEYHGIADDLMFYEAGEYGGKTARPHYHMIIFNLWLPKNDIENMTYRDGKEYWRSKLINKLWGKGITELSPMNWSNAAYTARYCLKKIGNSKKDYEKAGIKPEYTQASTCPAIGLRGFYDQLDAIQTLDKIIVPTKGSQMPPRYYDRKLDILMGGQESKKIKIETEDGDSEIKLPRIESQFMKERKEKRRQESIESMKRKLAKTNLSLTEYLKDEERRVEDKVKEFRRQMSED